MQDWRMRVQTRMMTFGALLAFPAVVQTLLRTIQHPEEWYTAMILILLYVCIIGLAFYKRIPARTRGWLLITFLYLVGVLAMARGGLWGDGRIYLVMLPVFGIMLIDVSAGMILTAISVLTYGVFALLNHVGVLEGWIIAQEIPMPTEIWLYDGLIFATVMIVTVIMIVDFYKLLMKALSNEHTTAQNLREAHQQLDQAFQDLEGKVSQRTAELAEANQRLRQLVNHDPLTGLPNRILFYDRLLHAIARAKRTQKKLAVLFIDLDNFKVINDTLGHIDGDTLLIKAATRIESKLRESDTVSRLSGDEFGVILENLSKPLDAGDSAKRMLEVLDQPFELFTTTASLSASIGISIYPDDAEDPDDLVRLADIAMYNIKHSTKNNYQFYSIFEQNKAS